MHVRTLLKQFQDHPGFVFHDEHIEQVEGAKALVFEVRPREGGKGGLLGLRREGPRV
jgi:hypothetical protein